MFTALIVLF